MQALKRRLDDHAAAPGVRYTQVIVNHGREAGASLAHPHAQILGLPFVPTEVLDEERAFARFAGGCVICTTIDAEELSGDRVVFTDADVVCVAPFWSGAPYELLLMPRRHEGHLQAADDDSLEAMGRAIRDVVAELNSTLGDVAFNLGIHSAPHEHAGEYHWHVHLWPNLVTQAGFERGTGVMINVVPPEDAAARASASPTPAPPPSSPRSARSGRPPIHWHDSGRQRHHSDQCSELAEDGGRRRRSDDDDDERGAAPGKHDGDGDARQASRR